MTTTRVISDAESLVIRQLWQPPAQAVEELAATLGAAQGWQPATVKTLLNRLLKKGALTTERDGRRFLYAPAFPQEAWVADTCLSLIDRLLRRTAAPPLVPQFASERKLQPEDIEALTSLLKEQRHESTAAGRPTEAGGTVQRRDGAARAAAPAAAAPGRRGAVRRLGAVLPAVLLTASLPRPASEPLRLMLQATGTAA